MSALAPQTNPDAFVLEQFGGMLPAWNDHLIPQNQASSSQNGYLFSGTLEGWRTPKLLHTLLDSAAKFAYRLPRQSEDIANAILYVLAKPVDGDTVDLGEEVYTFRDVVAAAYDVLIGADAVAAATHLFAAFTIEDGKSTNVGVWYGTGTTRNPAINQHEPVTTNVLATDTPRIQVFAPTFGAAYNSTAVVASNAARLEWRYNDVATTHFQGGTNLSFDTSITGSSVWIEFADPDTDVMRSPVVDDSFDRYYFVSPSVAPKYNTRDRLEQGLPHWLLGVPAPGCSPGVTVTGGGDNVQLGFPTSNTATVGNPGGNVLYLVPVIPDGNMILNDVSGMPMETTTTAEFAAVVYDDLNGSPNQLLNVGVPVVGLTSGTEVSSAFVNPSGLLMNVQYWIGFMTNQDVIWQQANDTGSTGVIALNTYTNGPPAIINNLQTNFAELQVWGNLTSTSVQEARAYVYTYLTEYEEESPPSPATTVTGWSNGTWTVDLFTPPPDQMGVTRNITQIRLYRSVTSQAGATTYFWVADIPVTTAQYVDIISDDVVVTNFELQSQLYTPPPEGLLGIIAMPNGMAVGWKGNEIWFSEPYRPHAWPPSYVLTTEYPIVGLGVTGYSVVAATSGAPYVASGTSPGSMSALKIQNSQPCHSRRSILGTNDGVYYASPNGLILVTQYGAMTNTTEAWITRQRWQELTPQKNLCAMPLVSNYLSLGVVRNGDVSEARRGFTIELNASDARGFSAEDQPGGHRLGFQLLTGPNGFDVDNIFVDPWSAVGCVLQNGGVYYYDFTDQAPVSQTYTWKSKLFQQKSKKNFEAMRCWFTIPEGTPALNATRLEAATDDPVWNSLPADRYAFIKVYASGNLVTCREVRVPQEILRILSGFKGETWQFEILGRVPISNLQVGSSVKALASI
jgi:hypothetical protein